MKKQKDGRFKISLTLTDDQQYQFRYSLDGENWENDCEADSYIPNTFGTENSDINLEQLPDNK